MRACQQNSAFSSLESSLESLLPLIAPPYRDGIYLLLWEIASDILKHALKDLHAKTHHSSEKESKQAKERENPKNPLTPHSLSISTCHAPHALQVRLDYCVAIAHFVSSPPPLSLAPALHAPPRAPSLPLATLHREALRRPPLLDPSQSHRLGHKLIGHYGRIFCYNAPQLHIPTPLQRSISLLIKGQYLACHHCDEKRHPLPLL